jgi:tRNA threonylcarbamoyl adenosine modification protein (Sua5/YciO/YrdC/YwlC family)
LNSLDEALAALAAAEAIVLPTDTVYGVGALPEHPRAIAAIFAAKGRPEAKALPILAAEAADLAEVARLDDAALLLARRLWPGPLTLVLPRAATFTHDLGGDDPATVAVRVPAFEPALELLRRSGPLAVTSANLSGQPPASTVREARDALGHAVRVFLDGGRVGGVPSTVVRLVGEPVVLREGAVAEADIASILADAS